MDVGAQLRSSREGKRLSLESLARTIRVQPRVLVAIERNDTAAIPPRPFGRGFVRAYAREVGLNPDQTVREYFGQFAPADLPSAAPDPTPSVISPRAISSRLAVSAALAIAILVVGAGVLMRVVRHPATDSSVVGTSGTIAPPAASGDSVTPKPESVAAAAVTPSRPIAIAIEATAPCWVSASADGKRAMYQLMNRGEKSTLLADREVTLLAGNAAGLTWTVNGRPVGSFGGPGVVRTVTVTPENVGTIK
jgi:cytoskeletal protein RodZ